MIKLKKRLGVLVSGGGTNLQAVIDACESGDINAEVSVVISSNPEAYALTRAKNKNIPGYVCALKDYKDKRERDKEIENILKKHSADYIVLAGYLGILSPEFVKAYPYKIINIHPALLPSYGGKNYYGIKVHEAVIAAKEPFSGATAHFVDENIDTGLIIAQEKIAVDPSDTPETLQQKILKNIEHKLLTGVIKEICDGSIKVENGRIVRVK